MLLGEPPFTGPTAQAIVAKVMTEEPAPAAPRGDDRIPPHVEAAVLTALEKLPADRFATAAEFAAAIRRRRCRHPLRDAAARRRRARRARAARRRWHRRDGRASPRPAGGLSGAARWRRGRPPSRLAIVEPGASVAFNGVARTIDISADGQIVVYAANHPLGTRVLARRLDGSAGQPIPNTPNVAHVRLSPDAEFLYSGYGSATMQRMPLAGGGGARCAASRRRRSWRSPRTVRSCGAPKWASEPTGTARTAATLSSFPASTIGQVLPGDRHAIGVGLTTGSNYGVAQLMDLHTGEVPPSSATPVVEVRVHDGVPGVRAPRQRDGGAPFDLRSRRVTGAHVEIASDVLGERDRVRPVRRSGKRDRGVHPGLRERPDAGEPRRPGAGPDRGAPSLSQPANLARRPPHRVRPCVERGPRRLDLVGRDRRPDAGHLPARWP